MQGSIQEVAYQFPDFTQAILALKFVHLAILFIVLRRLSQPVVRWPLIAALVMFEVVLGVSGFFAGFREPLVMAVVALSEIFNPRRLQHWIVLSTFGIAMLLISLMWMSVRTEYRQEFDNETFAKSKSAQVNRMATLSTGWWQDAHDFTNDTDSLVDRLWVVYYPALAVSRVPSVLPHTDGSIMWGALQHILSPRVFFPTKAELQNDSEMVNKYSGVHVAGTETGTSIAFGYAAESYIDFGLPWMFIPGLPLRNARRADVRNIEQAHPARRAARRPAGGDLLALVVPVRAVLGEDARSVRHAGHLSRRSRAPARLLLVTASKARETNRTRCRTRCSSGAVEGPLDPLMRVLHVTPYFAPAFVYGGPPRSVLGLCRALQRAGARVDVVTTTANGSAELPPAVTRQATFDGVPVTYVPRSFPKRHFRAAALTRVLDAHAGGCDLVHVHGCWNLSAGRPRGGAGVSACLTGFRRAACCTPGRSITDR